MYALCIESSHRRGMGHFFRMLNVTKYLQQMKENYIVLLNNDTQSVSMLEQRRIPYEIVDYADVVSNWESEIIKKHQVDVWFLDKFSTSKELVEHVKEQKVIVAGIDDCGPGAAGIDIHFCSMLFQDLKGEKIYCGKDYLILNSDIEQYRRVRQKLNKIVVTLGGSDTYGVTVKVVEILKELQLSADIIVGPHFKHMELLKEYANENFKILSNVPSLIKCFQDYDLAITGGGVTCFEANASGLPCIIVANEIHEIAIGKYLSKYGGARFAGYYKDISSKDFDLSNINIEEMSRAALQAIPLDGMDRIYKIIDKDRKENAR